MELNEILNAYGLQEEHTTAIPFGNGLINHTWKIHCRYRQQDYILQRINTAIFKNPAAIAANIRTIGDYLHQHHPEYLFVTPVKTTAGAEMYEDEIAGHFRLFPFLENSHTIDVVSTPFQAYEASRQFATFTRLLSGVNAMALNITLPDFHNLTLRYQQFIQALNDGNEKRIRQAGELIYFLIGQKNILDVFEAIKHDQDFKMRVTHHDTKISNVLFDEANKGLCVIDLDTVMPGYFISDVGDMMRTYLSPVSEEESDFSKIEIREDYFHAIVDGYLSEMKNELSEGEKAHFVYAGKFMIYMQALRFLTDHLNNDIYYGARYEGHNFIRAQNQVVLLQKLIEKEEQLTKPVSGVSVSMP